MEKIVLIIGLIGLILLLAGCTQETQIKDCGTDLDCFEESIKNGENAKVKYVEGIQIPPNHMCFGCNTYFTTKNTEAEIIKCDEKFCEVNLTKIKVVSDLIDVKDETWENAKCGFVRDETITTIIACKKIE